MNFTLPSVSNPSIWFNNYTQNRIDFKYPIIFINTNINTFVYVSKYHITGIFGDRKIW